MSNDPQKEELAKLSVNPGDRLPEEEDNRTPEEKAKQTAVDSGDITGEHLVVPTYFVVEDKETGEKEALHHVKDAEEISDVVREARVDEEGNRQWR